MADEQITLRDMLESNIDAAEDGTLGQAQDAPTIQAEAPAQETAAEARARDEQGRFAEKAKEAAGVAEIAPVEPQQSTEPAAPQRPNTWKKEYLPIYDKVAAGTVLTPDESKKLAAYSIQREKEYATGVSTYRAEAQQAKHLQDALAPFMPTLQKQNLQPQEFIKRLGSTYHFLVNGSPQEKVNAFAALARDTGIPLQAILQNQGGQQQVDPMVAQLIHQHQQTNAQLSQLAAWKAQQENQEVQSMISEFDDTTKYPHFEQVRGTMGRLLETGFTTDLKVAYAKAVRMDDDVWSAEQERQAQSSAQQTIPSNKAAVAAAAKAKAVSVRSVTPSGAAKAVDAKDLRSGLEGAFAALESGRV